MCHVPIWGHVGTQFTPHVWEVYFIPDVYNEPTHHTHVSKPIMVKATMIGVGMNFNPCNI